MSSPPITRAGVRGSESGLLQQRARTATGRSLGKHLNRGAHAQRILALRKRCRRDSRLAHVQRRGNRRLRAPATGKASGSTTACGERASKLLGVVRTSGEAFRATVDLLAVLRDRCVPVGAAGVVGIGIARPAAEPTGRLKTEAGSAAGCAPGMMLREAAEPTGAVRAGALGA